jgi:hypothetical protein
MNAGIYRCEVVSNSLAHVGDKKTPSVKFQLKVCFNIATPNIAEGGVLYADLWLTDAAFENTMKTLSETFGWNGEDISELNNGELLFGIECNAVVEIEEYDGKLRPKVKFLNNPNRAQPAMENESAKALADSLKGRILAFRAKNGGKGAPVQITRSEAAAIDKAGAEATASMAADTGLPF